MFERLERNVAALAEKRASDRRERVVARIATAVPEVTVAVADEAVTIAGRGLGRRYDRSAALRWTISEACDER